MRSIFLRKGDGKICPSYPDPISVRLRYAELSSFARTWAPCDDAGIPRGLAPMHDLLAPGLSSEVPAQTPPTAAKITFGAGLFRCCVKSQMPAGKGLRPRATTYLAMHPQRLHIIATGATADGA